MKHDHPEPPPSPVPARRIRHDGWTVARQDAFLKALAACGCISDAARAVGMSRQSAHNLYQRPSAAAFRRAFDAALDAAMPLVESGAWERSIKGVPRPVFHRGEQVGEYRHFDERLTMFLLRYRRPHRYRDLPVPPVVHPPGWEEEGPDPDEAIGSLDFHLDDLVDEAELPGAPDAPSRAIEGVNFVNFVGFRAQEHPGDASSTECAQEHPGDASSTECAQEHPGEQPFRHAGGMPACGGSSTECDERAFDAGPADRADPPAGRGEEEP